MDIKEYANKIAEAFDNAEVKIVTKVNGVIHHGIVIKEEGKNTSPTIYIDDYYKQGISVNQAREYVKQTIKEIQPINVEIEFVKEYEKIKGRLIARLVNEKKNDFAGMNAKKFGFPDLKIVPFIDMGDIVENGKIRVTEELIKMWGKSIEEITLQAVENIKEDIVVKTMRQTMAEMSGIPESILPPTPDMFVMTNKEKIYGAISALFVRNEFDKKYPWGYTVIPSSVHEVLVIPKIVEHGAVDEIIKEVNQTTISEEDYLSDHAYEFV